MFNFSEKPNWMYDLPETLWAWTRKFRSMELEIQEANLLLDALGAPKDKTIARRIAKRHNFNLDDLVWTLKHLVNNK